MPTLADPQYSSIAPRRQVGIRPSTSTPPTPQKASSPSLRVAAPCVRHAVVTAQTFAAPSRLARVRPRFSDCSTRSGAPTATHRPWLSSYDGEPSVLQLAMGTLAARLHRPKLFFAHGRFCPFALVACVLYYTLAGLCTMPPSLGESGDARFCLWCVHYLLSKSFTAGLRCRCPVNCPLLLAI